MSVGSQARMHDDRAEAALRPLPTHIAIIMDGNGRWARAHGLPRFFGHRRGVEALRAAVRHAGDRGIKYLTLFSFSSENWRRPAEEVSELFGLVRRFIRQDLAELNRQGVRVRVIGEREGLPPDLPRLIEEAERTTADNTRLTLTVAFNYGSRNEIARAARRLAKDVAAGRLAPEDVDDAALAARLDTAGIPDPDLVIRTSGEQRLSNFLLWQAAYAEFVFMPMPWPDFSAADLDRAIRAFQDRDRRFGGLARRAGS